MNCANSLSILCNLKLITNSLWIQFLQNSTSDYDSVKPRDELELALAKASMANKTVIIAVVNKAYANQETGAVTTMLDVFLDSFWLGEGTRPLVKHILLVTVDQTAYDRCQFLHLNCFRLVTDGVDFGGEKLYMSEDFIKMMWRRTEFLLEVLKRGYNFIFTVRSLLSSIILSISFFLQSINFLKNNSIFNCINFIKSTSDADKC